jgi:ankyrin repeat protein
MHLLLKRGAQAYLRVPGVDTCLVSLAITRRSDEACELLLSYNPPIELESAFDRIRGVHTNGPLALAVIYDMPKTAERLLQRGCSVYMVIKPPIKDFTLNYESEDILQYLAGHQRVDMLRLFVKYGLRVPNEDYVAYGKYTEAREKWVQEQMYELELDFSDLPEKHPLDIAIERDNLEIARMLLEAGAMFEDMEDVIEQVASVPMKNLLRDWLQDLEALASDSELV